MRCPILVRWKTRSQYLEGLRFCLIREYVGAGDGKKYPGNEQFRQRLVAQANLPRELLFWEHKHIRERIVQVSHDFGLRPKEPCDNWWGYQWLYHLVSSDNFAIERYGYSLLAQRAWAGRVRRLPAQLPGKQFTIKWEVNRGSDFREIRQNVGGEFNRQLGACLINRHP